MFKFVELNKFIDIFLDKYLTLKINYYSIDYIIYQEINFDEYFLFKQNLK